MQKYEAIELLNKFKAGKCSEQELAWLESWYLGWNKDHKINLSESEIEKIGGQMWLNIDSREQRSSYLMLKRVAAIAAVVACLFLGIAFYIRTTSAPNGTALVTFTNDIAPGKTGATLTLSNGQQIVLKDVIAGDIAKQSGVRISKTAEGQIVYEVTDKVASSGAYNTLSAGRGEQTQIRLPDGTLVFLNAESSLNYPASFALAKNRTVYLTGEGYFEVVKNKAQPFVVNTANQQIEVLGTHFNVNSYMDGKSVKTTLLEGSVKLTAGRWTTVIKPGQQAELSKEGIALKAVEVTDAIAWKDGYFMFNNESLENVMSKIGRWYNVNIVFEDPEARKDVFFGTISKYENISKVLYLLSETRLVTFKIEGHTIRIFKIN